MAETGKKLHLEIITPDATVLETETSFVLVRALDGDLGIMPDHAPLIASLQIRPLYYRTDTDVDCISVAAGFLEVNDNVVTVITPAAERPDAIDVERAERAKTRAEKRLHEKKEGLDEARAEAALHRALQRIEVARKYGGR